MNTIYLAGGCFWGMQKFIDQFDGVTETEVGYANGPDEKSFFRPVLSYLGYTIFQVGLVPFFCPTGERVGPI
jgi:peptide methionine sulfoxide reductase msrA/msrB